MTKFFANIVKIAIASKKNEENLPSALQKDVIEHINPFPCGAYTI